MLNLTLPAATPAWLPLVVNGMPCRVQVKPLTTAMVESANYVASQEIAALRARAADLEAMGTPDPGLPDVEDVAVRMGLWNEAFVATIARMAIVGWEDIAITDNAGAPLEFSPDVVAAAMRIPEVSVAFEGAYLKPLRERSAEKNASRPSPNGTSAEGHNIASTAAPTNGKAPATPAADPGTTAPTAPTLITTH